MYVSTINFIIQGNYKATCFDYRLVILRSILSIVSQDVMHTLDLIVFTCDTIDKIDLRMTNLLSKHVAL